MAMSCVMLVSHIAGGVAGSKGSGVVGEVVGVHDWWQSLAGNAVHRWGEMVRVWRGEHGTRTYRCDMRARGPEWT